MGTNFYWFKDEIKGEAGTPIDTGLHIGKNSCGWVFHFASHPMKYLISYYQWKEFTKRGYIYDEYGDHVFHDEFWEMVDDTKSDFNGHKPYDFINNPENSGTLYEGDYMNQGFMFSECDFS